jgi:WD40 repeat protein
MPTSCSWAFFADDDQASSYSSTFLVTYQEPLISIFDASTGKEKGLVQVPHDQTKPLELQQINKVLVSEEQGLIIAGTEDNLIRFFDLHTHKQVKSMVAHTDSVATLMIPSAAANLGSGLRASSATSNQFLSGGHDGAVRSWDLRTF